ncbi:MAG: hypothetical protein NVS4B8_03330 [Herpetosiphon sp.]
MRISMLITIVFLLAGCGSAASSGTGNAARITASPTSVAAVASAAQPDTVEAAAADEARKAFKLPAQPRITSKEAREWPNSALGCEAAGMMYTQVLTPGFIVMVTDGSKQYEMHTDQSGKRVVACPDGKPLKGR